MPIEESTMEKKNAGKAVVPGKCNQDPKPRIPDYNGGSRVGGGGRGGRRSTGQTAAAAAGQTTGRRPQPQRSRQAADKRPRDRGSQATACAEYGHREQVAAYPDRGFGTTKGSKKGYHDVSYLVNFRCESARDAHAERYSGSQWHQQRHGHGYHAPGRSHGSHATRMFRPRHVKEQYLQAKCQLVVRAEGDYSAELSDPDRLVDWAAVEQVWLHEDGLTTCPICLYPPTAARITRCGHVYCVACLLHYLALSDQAGRRCPICEETVRPEQVRRCRLLPRPPPAHTGDTIAFRLMRRPAGQPLAQPADEQDRWTRPVGLDGDQGRIRLARLITATPQQVLAEILSPERTELEQQLAELADQPEACFVQQALNQLTDDQQAAAVRAAEAAAAAARPRPPSETESGATAAPLPAVAPSPTAAADAIVYQSAFDDQVVEGAETAAATGPLEAGTSDEPAPGHVSPETEKSEAATPGQQMKDGEVTSRETTPTADTEAETEEVAPLKTAVSSAAAPVRPCGAGARQRSVSETSGSDVTAADLEVPHAEPGTETGPDTAAASRDEQDQALYFYQAEDGEPVFLHALNCRMLLSEHGGWWGCPRRLTAPLVAADAVTVTAGLRQRLRALRHLPITSQLQVVEVKLTPPIVSADTLALFKDQIKKREQHRREKQRRERQLERRQRQEERRRPRPADALYAEAFPVPEEPPRPPTPPPQQQQQPEPEPDPAAPPSFAQLLRAGAGAAAGAAWPSAVRPVVAAAAAVPAWEAPAPPDDPGAAPRFSDSWSADLAAALERAEHERGATGAAATAGKPKGRKGRKGKTVLISGGMNF